MATLVGNQGGTVVPGPSFELVSPPGRALGRVSHGMPSQDLRGHALQRLFNGLATQR